MSNNTLGLSLKNLNDCDIASLSSNEAIIWDSTSSLFINSKLPSGSLANTAVTAGSYTLTDLTVNAQGQITAASNGSAMTMLIPTTASINYTCAKTQSKLVGHSGEDSLLKDNEPVWRCPKSGLWSFSFSARPKGMRLNQSCSVLIENSTIKEAISYGFTKFADPNFPTKMHQLHCQGSAFCQEGDFVQIWLWQSEAQPMLLESMLCQIHLIANPPI